MEGGAGLGQAGARGSQLLMGAGVRDASVLHLLKELVGGVFIAILLHLGKVALLRGDCSINLSEGNGWMHSEKMHHWPDNTDVMQFRETARKHV